MGDREGVRRRGGEMSLGEGRKGGGRIGMEKGEQDPR